MKDPAMVVTWQTAFGKDFGGMAQGDNKTGQKGTNSMFVMTHNDIKHIPSDQVVTYTKVVVDYRPQKEDPNRIQITAAGGNLITYPDKLYTRTANLTTSKLLILHAKNATTLPVCTIPQTIWISSTIRNTPRQIGRPIYRRNKTPPTHYRQHTLLRSCCQHDSPHGPQHHCKQASKGHPKHHESSTSIVGLPCYSPKCKSLFPRFLPLQTKCTQPSQRPFSMGSVSINHRDILPLMQDPKE